jgi:dTDP-4-dehydrorhamnose reductase
VILVFGERGQVASALKDLMPSAHFMSSRAANFLQADLLPGILDKLQPKVIVNCSAYTAVDKAETERDECLAVNMSAPQAIARWCGVNEASLIHFSTDYVYPGVGEDSQSETTPTGPQNWYGETKLLGEEAVRNSGCRSVILRTSWVYSHVGHNFVKTMLRLGESKEALSIVSDQIGSPTYAPDLAQAVSDILPQFVTTNENAIALRPGRKACEVYNISNQGFISWHGFAEEIFRQAAGLKFDLKVKSVSGIPSEQYPTPAKRPLNSRLDQTKLQKDFGIQMPAWQDSLNLCLRRIKG